MSIVSTLLLLSPSIAVGQRVERAAAVRRAATDSLFVVDGDAPGCAVGVRHNGVVVHRAGYGLADLEQRTPITPSSLFYTGSLSKQFTALALALAERDGLLDVDDRLRRWIPELDASADSITIRHLVHHTGGLREKWDLLALKGVPVETTVITQAMVVDLLARQRGVLFPAGTRYSYSNSGYDLLGTIIERATGKTLRQYAAQRIFAPLGMKTALYGDNWGEVIPGRVMGHTESDGEWLRLPAMVETVGSGSVYASVDDLLAWLASWENGLLGDSTLQRQLETVDTLAHGRPLHYAWGLMVDDWREMRRVHHSGSLAGYRTAMWRLPDENWAAVVLCNSAEAAAADKIEELAWLHFPPEPGVTDQLAGMRTGPAGRMETGAFPDDLPGEYWSDELQVKWTIVKLDTSYALRVGTVPEMPVRGVHREAVIIGTWYVQVERDSSYAITGLSLRNAGVSGVRFDRWRAARGLP